MVVRCTILGKNHKRFSAHREFGQQGSGETYLKCLGCWIKYDEAGKAFRELIL